ncbi:MAG: 4Fe-4S cluster-binding domain-containing protein, partial [Smithella sp.]
MTNKETQGTILEIVRMSTEDGPGLRTTVFFKGCSLNCSWCHNPESISPKPQIHWLSASCIGCGICV